MFLKIVKKLRISDSERIKDAIKKYNMLVKLKDFEFLCEDLDKNNVNNGNFPIINESLGPFLQPKYDTVLDLMGTNGRKTVDFVHKNINGPTLIENLQFEFGAMIQGESGISLSLSNLASNFSYFNIGPFETEPKELGYGFKYPGEYGNIFEIARYFHNKRSLYSKIHEILLDNINKQNYVGNIAFMKDIALLFSIKETPENIPDFSFIPSNIGERGIVKINIRSNMKLISKFLYPKEKNEKYDVWNERDGIWFNGKDKIIIYCESLHSGYTSFVSDKSDCKTWNNFNSFIIERTNEALKHLISLTNFGYDICEIFRNKLFLENL